MSGLSNLQKDFYTSSTEKTFSTDDGKILFEKYQKYIDIFPTQCLSPTENINCKLTLDIAHEMADIPFLDYSDANVRRWKRKYYHLDHQLKMGLALQIFNQIADEVIEEKEILPILEKIILQYQEYITNLNRSSATSQLSDQDYIIEHNYIDELLSEYERVRGNVQNLNQYYEDALTYFYTKKKDQLPFLLQKIGYSPTEIDKAITRISKAHEILCAKPYSFSVDSPSSPPLYLANKFQKLLKMNRLELLYDRGRKSFEDYIKKRDSKNVENEQVAYLQNLATQYYIAKAPLISDTSKLIGYSNLDIKTKYDAVWCLPPTRLEMFDFAYTTISNDDITNTLIDNTIEIITSCKKFDKQLQSSKDINFSRAGKLMMVQPDTIFNNRKSCLKFHIERLESSLGFTLASVYPKNKSLLIKYMEKADIPRKRINKILSAQ